MVDLFVTATDLQGLPAPIHLTGARLDEKIHKTVFHFAYDGGRQGRNDFTPEYDAMLAFAARCTSSFPVAFPPMRFSDMPRDAQRPEYAGFFLPGWAHEDRLFADGGYLHNRPFSHAIDLIPFRPTTLPGERKLIFVDPFPRGDLAAEAAPQPVDFLQNARLAASTIAIQFGLQSGINLAVNLNLIPPKGMTLPFVSYGGTSMLAIAFAMGLMLALTRKKPEERLVTGLPAHRASVLSPAE